MSINKGKLRDISNEDYYQRKAIRLLLEDFDEFVSREQKTLEMESRLESSYKTYAEWPELMAVSLEPQEIDELLPIGHPRNHRYYNIGGLLELTLNSVTIEHALSNIAKSHGWIFDNRLDMPCWRSIGAMKLDQSVW